MTKLELDIIDREIEQIKHEIEWRDPDLEHQWWTWAMQRLDYLCEILEASLKYKYRKHLKIIK